MQGRGISACVLPVFLVGCGGGSTTALATYIQSPQNSQPQMAAHHTVAPAALVAPLAIAAPVRTGVPSDNRNTLGLGAASVAFSATTYGGWSALAETRSGVGFLPDRHLRDTGAAAAWAQGWTGLGQTIAIIDDFMDLDDAYMRVTVPRQVQGPEGGAQTYDVDYDIYFPGTHGALVSNIAGGDGDRVAATALFDAYAMAARQTGCAADACALLPPEVVFDLLGQRDLSVSYTYMAGVASEAHIDEYHVDLSDAQDPNQTLTDVLSAVDLAAGASAINLSIGQVMDEAGFDYQSYATFLTGPFGVGLTKQSDAVIAISAGNTGAECGTDLRGCNRFAVAGTILPETRASVIVVGATTGAGVAEEIADYSTRAGVLQDRYLVASGQTGVWRPGSSGALTEMVGTSFAAPRVAGAAAILRQKFPDLSGADAASVLLLTASKDINGDGVQDFSGTSSIYGHGKLDIATALSPIGTLAVR